MSSEKGNLDWSHLVNTGKLEEDPLEKYLREKKLAELNNVPTGQPTQQEIEALFKRMGFLVKEEDLKKKEEEYQNSLQNFYTEARKPIDEKLEKGIEVDDWGNGKSFNDSLSEEEKAERNKYIGDERGLGE